MLEVDAEEDCDAKAVMVELIDEGRWGTEDMLSNGSRRERGCKFKAKMNRYAYDKQIRTDSGTGAIPFRADYEWVPGNIDYSMYFLDSKNALNEN